MRIRNQDSFSLITPYDPLTAVGTLRAYTATSQPGGRREEILFYGDLPFGTREFELYPADCLIFTSWTPVFRCTLRPEGEGAVLNVKAGCSRTTRIFMAAWYGLLILATLGTLAVLLISGFRREQSVLAAVWALGFLPPHFAFWIPMGRAKKNLCHVLKAKEA